MDSKEAKESCERTGVNVTQNVIDLLGDLYDIQQELFVENEDDDLHCNEFESKWNELLKEVKNSEYHANSLFLAYYHLRLKNWRIGCGTKYGAHFLLYPQEKEATDSMKHTRIHSKYLVLHNVDAGNLRRLHAYIRLCKNIKKTLILTSFPPETYSEVNQKLLLNQKWINEQKLQSLSCNLRMH